VSWELALIASTLLSITLVPLLMRLAPQLGLLDAPNERKVHATPIPRVGGLAMVIAAALPILVWAPLRAELSAMLFAVLVLVAFGVWDDRGDLDYRLKFLGQIIATCIAIVFGGVLITRVPFFPDLTMPFWLGAPLTFFFVVGITNAINLSDGLDGLAGGTTLLILGVIVALALAAGDEALTISAVAIFGSILGFLRYNSYPARVFMGDTGSQFLGFSASVMCIVLVERSNTALSPLLPLLLLGLPILDTLSVMVQRIREGRSPFQPDKNHMHHKLMQLGFNHFEAVVVVYGVQTTLIALAFVLRYEPDAVVLLVCSIFALVMLLAFQFAFSRDLQVVVRSDVLKAVDGRLRLWRKRQWLNLVTRIPRVFVTFALPCAFILAAVAASSVTWDLGILAGLMLCILALGTWFEPRYWAEMLQRLSLYVAAATAAYALELHPGWLKGLLLPIDAVFVFIVVGCIGMVRFSGRTSFRASPMDLLVVLLVLLIPSLPDMGLPSKQVGAIAFKFTVLCYAAEILLGRGRGTRVVLWVGAAVSLTVVCVRGLF